MKIKRPIPFEFVLERLERLSPYTKPMFGCTSVYVGEKIFFILRDRKTVDDGIWVATTAEHHESLRAQFPNLRSIEIFGPGPTGWQVLPTDAPDFEEKAFELCDCVLKGDSRIGKTPKRKKVKRAIIHKTHKTRSAKKPKRSAKKMI